jgi:hypothetical protein
MERCIDHIEECHEGKFDSSSPQTYSPNCHGVTTGSGKTKKGTTKELCEPPSVKILLDLLLDARPRHHNPIEDDVVLMPPDAPKH